MKISDLISEAEILVVEILQHGQSVESDCLTHRLMDRYINGLDETPHADFIRCVAYHSCQYVVREALRHYRVKEDQEQQQLILPGYERLQLGYLIEHKGRRQVVPANLMTPLQWIQKVRELRGMVHGLSNHIREIYRFCEAKWGLGCLDTDQMEFDSSEADLQE